MNKEQINSLIRTIVKAAGMAMVAHGATKTAEWLNTEDVIGAIVLIVGVVMSHITHATPPELPKQSP